MTPSRIQLRRTKGWRLPEGAVVVARPTKWGNPYKIGNGIVYKADWQKGIICSYTIDAKEAVRLYESELQTQGARLRITAEDIRRELRGKDLACWCPLGEPCHADVLLRVANEPTW